MRIEIRHGGHVISDTSARGLEVATMQSLPLMAAAAEQATTPFDYMFRAQADDPASRLPQDDPPAMVAALKALGAAMLEDPPVDDNNSIIPALYTYWGQFIDHDLTANTDRDSRISDITKDDLVPVPPAEVVENLRNLRDPRLELDSVYEDAPRPDVPQGRPQRDRRRDRGRGAAGSGRSRARPAARPRQEGADRRSAQ